MTDPGAKPNTGGIAKPDTGSDAYDGTRTPRRTRPDAAPTATFAEVSAREAPTVIQAKLAAPGPAAMPGRGIDETQIIPRIAPVAPEWTVVTPDLPAADPRPRSATPADETTVFARVTADATIDRAPATVPAGAQAASSAAAPAKHHRVVWVGVVVFWLLGLGAGFVTLSAVGVRVTCSGTSKGLACGNTGSVLAGLLTICVVVLVGVISIHALESRARAKHWLRDFGIGIVILALLAFAAWLLIKTAG